jgi:hypothetical protein
MSFQGIFGGASTNKSVAYVRAEQDVVNVHHVLDNDGLDALKVIINNETNSPYQLSGIDWNIAGQEGNELYSVVVPPNSREAVVLTLPTLAFGHYAYTLQIDFVNQASINYGSAITILDPAAMKSFDKKSIIVDGVLDNLTNIPSVDMYADGHVRISDYGGETDLGGDVWFTWDEDYLYLSVKTTDDTFAQPYAAGDTWRGDGIQFAIAPSLPGESDEWFEFGVALTPQGPQVYRWSGPPGASTGLMGNASVAAVRDDILEETVYEAAIPWDDLMDLQPSNGLLSISLLVNDNDGQGRRGYIEWGAGIGETKDPGLFNPVRLIDSVAVSD